MKADKVSVSSPKSGNPRVMRLRAVLCVLLQVTCQLSSCTHLQVTPGSSLELPCLHFTSDVAEADITWTFNGEQLRAESSGSVQFRENSQVLSLSPVSAANQGEYVCEVKDNNVETTNRYTLTVYASVEYYLKVLRGFNVRLPCHFSSGGRVLANALWFKETGTGGRTSLDPSDDAESRLSLLYPLDRDQTLIIRETVMEDAGVYKCQSTAGETLSTVHVQVEEAPTPEPFVCEDAGPGWEPCAEADGALGAAVLQESMAEFSMKIYSHLRRAQPSSNLLFSPISISALLSHLLLGAKNTTRQALERAVCVPHNFACLHHNMRALRDKLAGSMEMASQIYHDPQLNLSGSFTNQSAQFYDAEPTRLLGTSEENKHMINSWVANNTRNKITHLVDSVLPGTQLMLLNAVAYSGRWKFEFDGKPRKGHFTKLNSDLVTVPILYQEKYRMSMMFSAELKAQVGMFPLSGDSSLYILLPASNKQSDLQQVEERMTDAAVRHMMEQMRQTAPSPVEVSLPMIKLDDEPNMNTLFKKLGLSSLFEDANLCGLYSEGPVVLDEARHRAVLALTERGVEAAAVSSIALARTFFSFSAMRPFVLLLWSEQANVPLFVGRVTEP